MFRGFDDVPGSLPPDEIPADIDLASIPFPHFAENALNNLLSATVSSSALWRDHLSLTGQVRTFYNGERIKEQWSHYSQQRSPTNFKATEASISRPTPDSSWVDVLFTFVTEQEGGLIGNCSGIISFLPSSSSETGWEVWMLRTILENFEGHGHPDDPSPIFSSPSSTENAKTSVLIIGAGQSGLSLAGRLGALNIPYILLEKASSIGYSWTGKYDTVRQHTIREMNNLPFDRTYKASDPTLLPAKIVAEGFQNYVKKYRINIWLDAQVEQCEQKTGGVGWEVRVRRGGEVVEVEARHMALSTGTGVSVPNPPTIENADAFQGTILDIGSFKESSRWKGKKGIVVGSATGAHDVAQDMLDNALSSITMIQRSPTPVFPVEWVVAGQEGIFNLSTPPEKADRQDGTMPLKISREVMRVAASFIDPARFDALERVGFRVDRSIVLNDWIILRGGGYYIDIGTSSLIAAGAIAVRSGDPIKRFLPHGLEFASGDVVEADIVVFATGYQKDPRKQAATVVGAEVAGEMRLPRGLDEEGELERYLLPVGKGLWLLRGAVNAARWNSRFVALQIQAEIMGKPFSDCRWGEDVKSGKL
ncbi:FAD/NAD(P)-binding domain-containing protein [Mollisia scopiformis]|uniref:FAD/NAD(P)-binding domain-containing protein n=1 Tax=Mollisia scopiformis TaxID=149040 RepID=A0A194XB91_MOLSC|nr:FAD/NAD(P)-binding domain-containing protein [Mollisia scopiformis]KUJ17433.1 FAD/NAD(P)-binding domain-containing protein [Mollisia scopiformis]